MPELNLESISAIIYDLSFTGSFLRIGFMATMTWTAMNKSILVGSDRLDEDGMRWIWIELVDRCRRY